ncbi:hypothetical protein V5O48_008261 [Marasmius crinis-equi]|uniref:Cytochrome P450 n=1 Tax=Marasmius crinis-equi TaxID=585013 RepID=A0ABR3FEE9_9AGAR
MAWLLEHIPDPRLARGRAAREISREVANQLVADKSKEFVSGGGNRDVMSLLGKPQPDIQTRLREEIRSKEREMSAQGRIDFTAEDFESLPYLTAVLKETLRYHPVGPHLARVAVEDQCIPLSESIKTSSGRTINEIPVSKGQKVVVSIASYNRQVIITTSRITRRPSDQSRLARNKEVYGEDAHLFKPERWLVENPSESESNKGPSVGVYASLLTFGGGVRACLGWRFAVLELQAFLVELIRNFEFSLTPECDKIRREICQVMVPTIEGELEKGGQCPLKVQFARRDD